MNTNGYIISICITSYNRPNELLRCLRSIDVKSHIDDVEIIISDDASPMKQQINELVKQYSMACEYDIAFHENEVNQGYDQNLGILISLARGCYIVFISDDDCFIPHTLDKVIDFVTNNPCNGVGFSPFLLPSKEFRRKYHNSFYIRNNSINAAKFLNDSILFSGLIFKRDLIKQYDAHCCKNLYYFQVYIFLNMIIKFGGQYIDIPLIQVVGDGENGFGLSESGVSINDIIDRKSIFSNLEFHKGLVECIKLADRDNGTNILTLFSKEYSLHAYYGMSKAKKSGKRNYNQYWAKLKSSGFHLSLVVYVYHLMLLFFDYKISDKIMDNFANFLIKYRSNVHRSPGR